MSHPLCSLSPCSAPEGGAGGWFCVRGVGEPWEWDFQDALHALRRLCERAWRERPDRPADATPRIECHWDPPAGEAARGGGPRRWRLLSRAPEDLGGAHLAALQAELEEQGIDAGRIELTLWSGGACRLRSGFGGSQEELVERCREILQGSWAPLPAGD